MEIKSLFRIRILTTLTAASLLSACASSGDRENSTASPAVSGSSDILDLLTGFGESISKRNFTRAVQYLTPDDRARILNPQDQVPEDMQKALMALPLQRLTRIPSVRVENGYLAGIYGLLVAGSSEPSRNPDPDESVVEESGEAAPGAEPTAAETPTEGNWKSRESPAEQHKAIQDFFAAIRQKNWNAALSLMNEDEKKSLLDDKGRLKDSSKQRLSRIDLSNRSALVLQEGKLSGVTLLLPMD